MLGEPDPVAEQRTLGERRGGVDRQHGDRAFALALELGERTEQRRLADSGRAGETDHRGAAGVRIDLADQLPALGVVVLDQRDRPGESPLVAVEQALGE